MLIPSRETKMIRKIFILAGCGILAVFFAACSPAAHPTDSPATVAAKTMEVILTQISDQLSQSETMAPSLTPSNTLAPTITDTPTIIPTVQLSSASSTGTLPPGVTPIQPTPTGPTPTIDPNSLLTRTLMGKCPAAFFVGDVGPIQDGSEVKAGTKFTKTWDVRNIGMCTWNRSYRLFFYTGKHMYGPNAVDFPEIVPPNKDTFLSVTLTAPDSAGIHTGQWYLQDDKGIRFGVGTDGDEPLIVKIEVIP
jgi:hypothetical protein